MPRSPHHFFPAGARGGHDGLVVQVRPAETEAWIGTFAFGREGNAAVTRVLGMPDPDQLCVVARGAGYFVCASAPERYEIVPMTPLIDVRAVVPSK